MKVRFIEDREVTDGAGRVIRSFSAGEEYDLAPASARRWLRRKAAVEVNAAEAVEPEPEVTAEENEPGEAESQPEPTGSEAGEDQPSSSPQAAPASQEATSRPSGFGKRRGRKKGG